MMMWKYVTYDDVNGLTSTALNLVLMMIIFATTQAS